MDRARSIQLLSAVQVGAEHGIELLSRALKARAGGPVSHQGHGLFHRSEIDVRVSTDVKVERLY